MHFRTSAMDFTHWNTFWTVTFSLTAIVVTTGNLITTRMFLKRRLRKRPHFLLISLAIADMLVGALSVPLYIAVGIHSNKLLLNLSFQCVDIFTGVISIFTLASISLERMHAIVWPFRHRALTSNFYKCVIGIPWIVGLLGILSRVLLHFYMISPLAFFVIINASVSTPLLFTSMAYFVMWRKHRCRHPDMPQAAGRDEKLAKTLFLITGAFIITWLPFHVINIVIFFCLPCRSLPYLMIHIMKVLQFSNSFINVIVYPLRISEYKEILLETLTYSLACFTSYRIEGTGIEQTTPDKTSSSSRNHSTYV